MNEYLQHAAAVGARASLLDIRLLAVSATLKRVSEAQLHLTTQYTFNWKVEEELLLCEVGCDIQVSERESHEEVFTAEVVYGCGFSLSEAEELTDESYDEFAKVNATMCLHPYIRETIQSLTSRAGLPPLVLPTRRVPVTVGAEPCEEAGLVVVDSTTESSGPPPQGQTTRNE